MLNDYITITEAAEKLQCGVSTLRKMCSQGKIPQVEKLHGVWLIPKSALGNLHLPEQRRGWKLGKKRHLAVAEKTPEVPMTNNQPAQAQVVAVFNQAGGVGKTTFVRDFAYELSLRGFRTLMIDADPQGTLGMFFGFEPATRAENQTFWQALYGGNETGPTIFPTDYPLLSIGLANRFLKGGELKLMEAKDSGRLRKLIRSLRPAYDFIIFDCPPAISEITVQILFTADALIIPVQAQVKAVVAFGEVQVEIANAQSRRASFELTPIKIMGVVPTMFKSRVNIQQHHMEEVHQISEQFGYPVLPALRDSVKVSEAGSYHLPLKVHDKACPVNREMEELVDVCCPAKAAKANTGAKAAGKQVRHG